MKIELGKTVEGKIRNRKKRVRLKEGDIIKVLNPGPRVLNHDYDRGFLGKECTVKIVIDGAARIVCKIDSSRYGCWWPIDYLEKVK